MVTMRRCSGRAITGSRFVLTIIQNQNNSLKKPDGFPDAIKTDYPLIWGIIGERRNNMPARPGSGRKVIPLVIKEAKGTRERSRERIVTPPSDKIARPPSALSKRAKQIFQHYVKRRLEPLGLASATYTEEIMRLAIAHEEYERLNKLLAEVGYTIEYPDRDGNPIVKMRPEVKIRDMANSVMKASLLEFGLTAASAQKVGAPPEKKKKDDKERFFD
jgi:P27 family predicted phage terminase small subunit